MQVTWQAVHLMHTFFWPNGHKQGVPHLMHLLQMTLMVSSDSGAYQVISFQYFLGT